LKVEKFSSGSVVLVKDGTS